jgi:hypothetical protein
MGHPADSRLDRSLGNLECWITPFRGYKTSDNFVFRSVALIISFGSKKGDRVSVASGGQLTVMKRVRLPDICSDLMADCRARAAEILSENKAGTNEPDHPTQKTGRG